MDFLPFSPKCYNRTCFFVLVEIVVLNSCDFCFAPGQHEAATYEAVSPEINETNFYEIPQHGDSSNKKGNQWMLISINSRIFVTVLKIC